MDLIKNLHGEQDENQVDPVESATFLIIKFLHRWFTWWCLIRETGPEKWMEFNFAINPTPLIYLTEIEERAVEGWTFLGESTTRTAAGAFASNLAGVRRARRRVEIEIALSGSSNLPSIAICRIIFVSISPLLRRLGFSQEIVRSLLPCGSSTPVERGSIWKNTKD